MKDIIDKYYKQHGKIVYYYLYKVTGNGDLAEELTQETFYQAMRTVDKYKGECTPSVWLCQIARHLWYQYLEKNTKIKKVSFEVIENEISDEGNNEFWNRQDKIELYKKIQTLDKEVKETIYLRLSGDLSFAEIGQIMGKSENWARVTFFRGKQQLMKGERI
ncbi:MAG: RNA polymerase sigma factor [Clostridiaceae bacterium]